MKKVKAEPELLTDFDKHLNIKKGMRGSFSGKQAFSKNNISVGDLYLSKPDIHPI